MAQDRAPFAIGKPFVRQPRSDTMVTPVDKHQAAAQRAAEIAERRAAFDANSSNSEGKVVHWHPCTHRPELYVETLPAPGRAWGKNEMPPQTKCPQNASRTVSSTYRSHAVPCTAFSGEHHDDFTPTPTHPGASEPRRRGEWGGGRVELFEHRNERPGYTRVPQRLPLGDT